MSDTFETSKRIQALRRNVIAAIPRFPNDKRSRDALDAKPLMSLLIVFVAWRLRYVAIRPREVFGHAKLAGDPRAAALKTNIDALLSVVGAGGDLTPYLSIEPRTKGYTPAARGENSWSDKDFLLNVMGLHHFHLGLTVEPTGHVERTNEIIFAVVKRDRFEILGLFDHAVFNHEDDGGMTPERSKLWSAFRGEQALSMPGQFLAGGYGGLGLSASGHPSAVVMTAQAHVRVMREIEPRLGDRDFLRSLYQSFPVPRKPALEWHYNHLDLGLLDRKAGVFGQILNGPD